MALTGIVAAQWQWIDTPVYNNPYYECGFPSYGGCVASGTEIYWTMTATCASPGMGQFVNLEIHSTGNCGTDWNEVYSANCGYFGGIIDLNFITPLYGYVLINLEYQYKLYRTNVSMTSVEECINPISDKILGVTMFSYDDIFAVNEAGGILHFENDTLVLIHQLPVTLSDNSVKPNLTYTDNHTLFLACKSYTGDLYENDLIFKSVDMGYTWDTCFISDMDFITDLKFSNDSLGFAIGNYGLILKTTDAGVSWDQIATGYYNNLFTIDFMNDQQWIIGGGGGLILYTEDEGETWTSLDSETNLNIKKIYFPDKDELIIAITGGSGLCKSNLDLLTTVPENNVSLRINIIPNPANQYIEVRLPRSKGNTSISIINVEGVTLITKQVQGQESWIEVGTLTQGVYFVRVQDEKGVKAGKFVKQ